MEPAVTIREARGREDYDACVDLQRRVWGLLDLEITSAIQLIATVHAGGLLLVAEAAASGIVGFSYGFAAWSDGASHLHSDMLAVLPDWRGRGVGLRLKWAQREAVLARGLGLVTWTFDPMRAKNARLNLRHLGATAREFLPDLYGRTSSALHHGLATDRLLARWQLREPERAPAGGGRACRDAAAAGRTTQRRAPAGRPAGELGAAPRPRRAGACCSRSPPTGTPSAAPTHGLAREWQGVVRRALEAVFARGYAATDVATPPGAAGVAYVLERLTPSRSRPAAAGRKTTRSRTPRRASRAGQRGAARAGRGRR